VVSPLIVVALGGNAIQPKGSKGTPEEQWRAVRNAARQLVRIYSSGARLVVTHGNGPQVGLLLEAFESLPPERPRPTLDLAVAMTQGWIGYLIQHSLEAEAREAGVDLEALVLVSRVVVSRRDPAFMEPTKYVGSYYTREEAQRLAEERGWIFREDPRGGYRRVVPSPRPLRVLEADRIGFLARKGYVVVGVGGGGIPVDEDLRPVEAVVDKDLASSVLARQIGADMLVILTDVPGVALNYGRPGEVWLDKLTVSEARRLLEEGAFPPGSMGPKVLAAVEFVEATGREAVIARLDMAWEAVQGRAGTRIVKG